MTKPSNRVAVYLYLVSVSLDFTFTPPSLTAFPSPHHHSVPPNSLLQGRWSPAVLSVQDGSGIPFTHSLPLLPFSTPMRLSLHPPGASCQTDPPCSLHPCWRMEKQSSRNSPDNCPPVIFSSPLSFSFCRSSAPSSILFTFKAFLCPSLFRELVWLLFLRRKKRKSLLIFSSRGTRVKQPLLVCWFSRNVNRTHRHKGGKKTEHSAVLGPDVAAATTQLRRCQRTDGEIGGNICCFVFSACESRCHEKVLRVYV